MDNETLSVKATEVARLHNERAAYTSGVSEMTFTGVTRCDGTCRELIPNAHNPTLMDVAEITRYSGGFRLYTKAAGAKRATIRVRWYQIAEETRRVEVGAYLDKR